MHLDRRDIAAGKRLWDQIADKITDPEVCDAWVFLVSHNSLTSQPCREELAYALDRALESRGGVIPDVCVLFGAASGISDDQKYFFHKANNEATPTQSYFLEFTSLPSELVFGPSEGPQFKVFIS